MRGIFYGNTFSFKPPKFRLQQAYKLSGIRATLNQVKAVTQFYLVFGESYT